MQCIKVKSILFVLKFNVLRCVLHTQKTRINFPPVPESIDIIGKNRTNDWSKQVEQRSNIHTHTHSSEHTRKKKERNHQRKGVDQSKHFQSNTVLYNIYIGIIYISFFFLLSFPSSVVWQSGLCNNTPSPNTYFFYWMCNTLTFCVLILENVSANKLYVVWVLIQKKK